MQNHLDDFITGLKEKLGDNLVSVILYGSATRSDPAKGSDINLLILVKRLNLADLSGLEKIISRGTRKAKLTPVFWTESELKHSLDVFPIEFQEILANRKILHGTDLFQGLTIEGRNLRHQIEFEMRSKLLRLRGEWLNVKGDNQALTNVLARVGTSFQHLFPFARKVAGERVSESLAEPFKICLRLKKGEIKLNTAELENLYSDVHEKAELIVSAVNHS